MWTAQPNGAADYFNPQWFEYTGLSMEQCQGDGWTAALHPEDAPRSLARWSAAVAEGEAYDTEQRFRRAADGQFRWHLVRVVPVHGLEGELVSWIGTCTDVHDQKQAEAAVQRAQKLESIGVLAGGVAHDFNNLLTCIVGNTGLSLQMLGSSGEVPPLLQEVLQASERAADLTRQLLAYAGMGRYIVAPVDLSELLPDVAGTIRPSVPDRVQLLFQVEELCPPVEADACQLRQLITNLVHNGAEAIGIRAGTVTIRVTMEEVSEITPGFQISPQSFRPGVYLSLSVTDTGGGMDAATVERIFDPFFTTKFPGRGLGLPEVQGIVRGHQGALEVHSVPGQGTTVRVLFPIAGEAAIGREDQAPVPGRGEGTILVVDDEAEVRSTIRHMLEAYGFTIAVAGNGEEAVDRLAHLGGEVELVLLDMLMPGMTGEETLLRLRQIRPDVRVMVMSGYGQLEAMRRFANTSVTDFLAKPFTPERLAAGVRQALSGSDVTQARARAAG
ncbi:MAG: response regulator [Gemmatimonadales bacterium]